MALAYRIISKIPILVVSLIIIALALLLISVKLMQSSLPDDFEESEVPGIKEDVRIYRNSYGIPHIIASNEKDMFYAMGYIHAQDRLWQMIYFKRTAQGRLSEILGKDYVSVDIYMRTLNIEGIAKQIWDSLDNKSKEILVSYCDGVNIYASTHKNKYSIEFGALNIEPGLFTPIDCISIMRGLSFELSTGFNNDITMGKIADKIGLQHAMELIPEYPGPAPTIIEGNKNPQNNNTAFKSKDSFPKDNDYAEVLAQVKEGLDNINKLLNNSNNSFGSNSWAIKSYRDSVPGVTLANDPHLKLTIPSKFYQIHLTSPGFNVTGLSVPGLPLVLIGRNDSISWGLTSLMADDADIFVERINDKRDSYFDPDSNKFIKFEIIEDTIRIKDEETKKYYLRKGRNSYVLTDAFRYSNETNKQNFYNKYVLTFNWTGSLISNEISALYKVNKAKNKEDFIAALDKWRSPSLIFNYGDKKGNFGVVTAGAIPKRSAINPNFPNPAWEPEVKWTGYITTNDLPSLHNPDSNFVVSANNKLSSKFEHYISSNLATPSRAARIIQLLNESGEYSYRDAQFMQLDVLSPYAHEFISFTIPILNRFNNQFDSTEKEALKALSKWDYIMSARNAQSSIYNLMLINTIENTFRDELGEELYNSYLYLHNYPLNLIMQFLFSGNEYWFDDKTTTNNEYYHFIILKSFKEAIAELKKSYGSDDISTWIYGNLNSITLQHPLDKINFLRSALNVGPEPINGNINTINLASWDLNDPFDVTSGPVARFIADMRDSTIYTSIAGGASGDPLSENYSDQFQLWLSGGYIQLPVSELPGEKFKLRIVLIPEN